MENKTYKLKTKEGKTICEKMAIANDMFARMKGLMFSSELPGCDGLLFRPANSIHTFFMLYNLDIIFMDKNFRVIKVIRDLRPWRMTWVYLKSYQVLEMKGGTLKEELRKGDILEAICIN